MGNNGVRGFGGCLLVASLSGWFGAKVGSVAADGVVGASCYQTASPYFRSISPVTAPCVSERSSAL